MGNQPGSNYRPDGSESAGIADVNYGQPQSPAVENVASSLFWMHRHAIGTQRAGLPQT